MSATASQAAETVECGICGFLLWNPIGRLESSALGLYDDARFPGRCILALDMHVEHFDELDTDTARAFLSDVQRAGRAIRLALNARRVNYAILGNTEPHVHAHLIPRFASDPVPTRPPWEHPGARTDLRAADRLAVIERIRHRL